MSEWQPIETAPRNGDRFLMFGIAGYEIVIGLRSSQDEYWCWAGQAMKERYLSPTHWMPLPPPPTEEPR